MQRYWVIAPYHADKPEVWQRVWDYDVSHNVISIGWHQLGNVSSLTEEELKERIDQVFHNDPPSVRTLYRRMLRDFYHSIKIGDVVVARRGRKKIAAIGTVVRSAYYEHNKNADILGQDKAYSNHLDVIWKPSPRDKTFEAVVFGMQTLYEIPKEKFDSLCEAEPSETLPATLTDEPTSQTSSIREFDDAPGIFERRGPLTVGSLTAANVTPVFVNRDCELSEATSEMRLNDYSQLPVMQNLRRVDGWISWKSIGKASGECKFVRECMDRNVTILPEDTPLLDAVRTISEKEVVLIQNPTTKEICGLVTTTDLADEYHSLAEPFLLIREIEYRLRQLVERARYPLTVLQQAKHDADSQREIRRPSDLTFGETVRLLKNPHHWSSLPISGHQPTIMRHLDRISRIRNRVMHFDEKPLSKEDLNKLRATAKFMREG